jgi:hypothetical protein
LKNSLEESYKEEVSISYQKIVEDFEQVLLAICKTDDYTRLVVMLKDIFEGLVA